MTITPSLSALLATRGVVEEADLASRFGVMAFHGGNLEVGTDQIAHAVADAAGTSRYIVRQPDDLRWHVPSTAFDPRESDTLAAFLAHVEVVVTIHGYGRDGMFTTVLLGGGNRDLASHLAASLRPRLTDYEIVDDLATIPTQLRGQHDANPVNQPRLQGVQVELPPRIRGNGPFWSDWADGWPTPHTAALVDGLVEGIRTWPT